MLSTNEVTKLLHGVSKNQYTAFTIRAALRELPLQIAQKKQHSNVFEEPQHLLDVFLVNSRSMESILDESSNFIWTPPSRLPFKFILDLAEYLNFIHNTLYSIRKWLDVSSSFSLIAYIRHYYGNLFSKKILSAFYDFFTQEIKADLMAINQVSTAAFLARPLWSESVPGEWQQWLVDYKIEALKLEVGFDVWLDWYDDRLQGKPIDIDLLKRWNRVPEEIAFQGPAEVNAYLKNIRDKTATLPLNRVRAIFIGYGEAGKTSLVRALHEEQVVEGKEHMTPGIEIRDWPVPDSDIQAHFWDFGGQVMAHATHQFFLRSSCLYVLVLNARSEIDGTTQAEYWLEHVKGFGKSAPVMIVGNKSDLVTINLDMSYLKIKYPNIVNFYPVSCTHAKTHYEAEFNRFHRDFCNNLQQVGTHQMLFTEQQFAVLESIRECSTNNAFLTHQEFENICTQNGIGTEGVQNRKWLLDILDKLGVVIHFPQLSFLDDYVLNPRWLTYGVYTLMYSKQAKLTESEIIRILSQQQVTDEAGNELDYPKAKCRFIMDAMQEFKLCYPLPGDHNTLIIPELLPSDQPETIPFVKQGALAFEFVFRGFLPRHVMPELIVNRHEEIVQQIVWQRGVLLRHGNHIAQALLEVDYHDRVLSIWVQGRDAKDYLGLLNDEVLKILKRLDLDYKEWITLPLSACINDGIPLESEEKAPYRQVLACARKGERIYISEAGTEYNLNQVLGIILSNDEQEKVGITQIFNSTVGGINMNKQSIKIGNNNKIDGSVIAVEKMENSFNSLQ